MAPRLTVSSAPPSSPTPEPSTNQPRTVWSVSRLNLEVRSILESGFGHIWIEGEISNLAQPRSGHMYFSLKDASCQVRCAMFKGQNRRLQFTPQSGQQVLARARVSLYAERGEYQLIVDDMEEGGVGALRRAFDALKAKLDAEGLFAPATKQPIPAFPRQIGIITSATGAAVHDIMTTLRRRFPALAVVLYPVPVQGSEAPGIIADAINIANARAECDVLIVARGGGSLEDLWAFNDERTARAISASEIPIVCGVGHEVDFTISDFVADFRAATPTAAAEAVTPDGAALALRVRGHAGRLTRAVTQSMSTQQRQLQAMRHRLQHPSTRLQQLAQHADLLTLRLQRGAEQRFQAAASAHASKYARLILNEPAERIVRLRLRLRQAFSALHTHMEHKLEQRQNRVRGIMRELHAISPSATLTRGYAIATDTVHGAVLRQAAAVEIGAQVDVRLATGILRCTVNETMAAPPSNKEQDSSK